MLALAFLLLAAPDPARLPQPVELASKDDCAILVAAASDGRGWPPDADLLIEWDRAGGGTYLQACSWAAMKVLAPRIGTPASRNSFYVSRPAYNAARTRASVTVTVARRGDQTGADGREFAPFMSARHCELVRRGGRWSVVSCRVVAIT